MLTVQARPETDPEAVLTKAVLRCLEHWGLTGREAARVLGLSEATLSRLRRGEARLSAAQKSFDLAVLMVRAFRSLDAITGGDAALARDWLRRDNTALGGVPLARMMQLQGLVDVVTYLDARRAPL